MSRKHREVGEKPARSQAGLFAGTHAKTDDRAAGRWLVVHPDEERDAPGRAGEKKANPGSDRPLVIIIVNQPGALAPTRAERDDTTGISKVPLRCPRCPQRRTERQPDVRSGLVGQLERHSVSRP